MGWTSADMADQTGKLAVVTGANSGIGLIAAGELARVGARVVLACRDLDKGKRAADTIDGAVEVCRLDLAELRNVRAFTDAFTEPLDLLVNNAGVMALPKRRTADGFEMQFGTNHLGHFALTGLLIEQLVAAPAPRVVTLTSVLGYRGTVDFDDLQGERRYVKWKAYSQSKLANLLFAHELRRRARGAEVGLCSVAAHPGYASTHLQATGPRMAGNRLMERMSGIVNRLVAQSAHDGALPTLYAATRPAAEVDDAEVIGPRGPLQMRGAPGPVRPRPRPKDLNEEVARRLWTVSEELTGVRYGRLSAAN